MISVCECVCMLVLFFVVIGFLVVLVCVSLRACVGERECICVCARECDS